MQQREFVERLSSLLNHQDSPAPPVPPRFQPRSALGDDIDELVRIFLARQAELGVKALSVSSREVAEAQVEALLTERHVSLTCAPNTQWVGIRGMIASPREAGFGLSEAAWAIAETGSVVLLPQGEHQRQMSLLPPSVGFFVQKSRVVARLGNVLKGLKQDSDSLPASVIFITGPSASADIAGVRTIGVHGPADLCVWLIENE